MGYQSGKKTYSIYFPVHSLLECLSVALHFISPFLSLQLLICVKARILQWRETEVQVPAVEEFGILYLLKVFLTDNRIPSTPTLFLSIIVQYYCIVLQYRITVHQSLSRSEIQYNAKSSSWVLIAYQTPILFGSCIFGYLSGMYCSSPIVVLR